jgi:phosphonate transport system ATP-binding protein
MRSSIGVVFQKHNLVPRLSVLTNVIHGDIGRLHNVSKFPLAGIRNWGQISASNRTRKKAMEALEMVSLSHLALQRADTLSGGQSQRVAIARALMQEPNMILADEPVASLDPVAANEVMSLFYDLCKNKNITLIFTSHNVEQALENGNNVLAIKNGRLSLFKDSNSIEIKTLQAEYD